MCIIIVKNKNINVPSEEILRTCYLNNPDGVGFALQHENKVIIEKGYMSYDEFMTDLRKYESTHDLTQTAMIFHFRITTHGKTIAGNCHPFPLSNRLKDLQSTHLTAPLALAHNGIIDILVDRKKGISDTISYIQNELYYIDKAVPTWYKNKDIMEMISNRVTSKLAILPAQGDPITVGKFVTDGELKYSNTSYKEYKKHLLATYPLYSYSYSVMPLPDGAYVMTASGKMIDADCKLMVISENDDVLMYNAKTGEFDYTKANAYTYTGAPLTYDAQSPTNYEIEEEDINWLSYY